MIVGAHIEIHHVPKAQIHLLHSVVSKIVGEIVNRIGYFLDNIIETAFDLIACTCLNSPMDFLTIMKVVPVVVSVQELKRGKKRNWIFRKIG